MSSLYASEKEDLAAAFQWTARLNMHEAVANHFSLAIEGGKRFLINPNQKHFSQIKSSDILDLNINEKNPFQLKNAPDQTAWCLHSTLHRHVPHAKCIMHVHPIYSTVLASLKDSYLKPIDQNTAIFFNRMVVDDDFGGLAFQEEGIRCAKYFSNPKIKTMIMGNHGLLILGDDIADAFNRMYYFERAAETYIKALQTKIPLRVLSDSIAEKTALEMEDYPEQSKSHFNEIKNILLKEGSDFKE
ncbi:class II aldolase/adducin family protein [Alphaproteobacteria bacterium]|nr:class II aldolase/adducin family protein [Alphaproteobacteria bacterium]